MNSHVRQQGTEAFLSDLHVHSTFSDGKMTIPEIVNFYGERGFGAIAITDHIVEEKAFLGRAASCLSLSLTSATFPLYREILLSEAKRAWHTYGLVLIPGFELSKNSWFNHRSAHILGLGVQDFISADSDIVDIAREIRARGGLAIAAHPVSTGKFEPQTFYLWSRREELRFEFDAWEVASGRKFSDVVHQSGLPLIATSDLHRADQINGWKTVFSCERNIDAIFTAIRKQELSFTYYQEPAIESESRTRRFAPRRHRTHDLVIRPGDGYLGNLANA